MLLLFGVGLANAQEQPATNMRAFQSLYEDVFIQIFEKSDFKDSVAVIKRSKVVREYNWLIEKALIEQLEQKGTEHIFVNPDTVPYEIFSVIDYQSVRHSLYYKNVKSKRTERTFNAAINVRVSSSHTGELLAEELLSTAKIDTVARKMLKKLENSDYPFTIGKRNRSFVAKLTEPFVVSIVTGFIIYLFYSYRSQ